LQLYSYQPEVLRSLHRVHGRRKQILVVLEDTGLRGLPSALSAIWVQDTTVATLTIFGNTTLQQISGRRRQTTLVAELYVTGFSIGSKGYFGCGWDGTYKNDFWEYDPVANTWTQKASFPSTARWGAAGFSIGTKGYIGVGDVSGNGTGCQTDFWEWDQATNTWSQKASFIGAAVYGAVGFSIGSKGYIGTGYSSTTSVHNEFYEWDQASNTWTQKANFGGAARYQATGFSIGTMGYIGTGSAGNDFWGWDQTTNTWTIQSGFPGTAYNVCVGLSVGGKGYIGTGQPTTQQFWEFMPCSVPAVTVSGLANICQGTGVTYVSSSTVAGGSVEWFVNGVSTANGSTMTYTPANGDVVTSVLSYPSAGCYAAGTDTSNVITMVVNANTTPTVSIAASANNACTGTSITYTATSNTTGGTYQWQVNNNPVGSGGGSYTYTPVNNDVVTVVFTPPAGGCYTNATATSNDVTMTVMPMLTPTLSISTPFTAVCAGMPTTFSATTNIGGGTMQWKVNGATVSNNLNSYTYSPQNNDVVTAVYTVPGTVCTGNPVVTSNPIPMSVAPMLIPSAVVSGPSSAVQGQPVTLTATLSNSGSSYYLTWKNKGVIMNTTTVPTITYTKGPGIDTITAQVIPLSAGCWDVPITNTHIVTEIPTGITETMRAAGIEVYPNPFSDVITVNGLKDHDQLLLIDMSGRIINSWKATKEAESFRMDDLAAGHYVLKLVTESGAVRVNVPVVKK
jgi:hypothetical protein